MTKLPAWHRDAPAPKPEAPKGRALWATAEPARDPNSVHDLPMHDPHVPGPDLVMPDGTAFDFKTLPPGTYPAKLTTKGAAKIIASQEAKLDAKKCIAAGGRMRCMDCRCGKPSPKNVTQERMPDYGKKSGHGRKVLGKGLSELIEEGDKTPRRFRCIEDPSAGLNRMIGNALRRCPQCDKPINGHPNKKFCGPKCKDRWHNTQNPDRLARAIARTGTAEPKPQSLSGLSLMLERKRHQVIAVEPDPDEYRCEDPYCLGCMYCIDYDDGEGWGDS